MIYLHTTFSKVHNSRLYMNLKYSYRICTIFFLSLLVLACSNKKDPQQAAAPPPVLVTVATVKDTSATYYNEYPAIISALNEVRLTAQVNGYITGIYFTDGSKVTKGQRLYAIDQQVMGPILSRRLQTSRYRRPT